MFWMMHVMTKPFKQTETVKVSPDSYLVIKLSGQIPEFSQVLMGFFGQDQPTVFELKEKILKAATDSKIKGIILKPSGVMIGYAGAHELTSALEKFRGTGKKVYAYIQMGSTKDYFLCAGSDKIFMNPSESGGLLFTGVGGRLTLMKDLFDKLGITMYVAQAGKFKGYTDLYTKNTLSPDLKSNMSLLFGDIYERLIADLSKKRNVSEDKMKWIFEQREDIFMTGKTAKSYGLVDSLVYEDDLYDVLNIPKQKRIPVSDYQIFLRPNLGDKVAVIYAYGSIMPNAGNNFNTQTINAKDFKKTIDMVKDDPTIKAVVLRINSPGGSSLESDIILNQLRKLKNIPIVVSMGDVDASGGYYITTASKYVYADPYTITGSIGVVSMIPKFDKMGKKIGIHSEGITYGKFSDIYDMWSPMTADSYNALQKSTESIYTEFKGYVGKSRNMTPDAVEAVAQGQVWSAVRAKNNKLVDEIGTLDNAVGKAAELAHLKTVNVIYYPKQRTIIDVIMEQRFGKGALSSAIEHAVAKEMGTEKAIELKQLISDDPRQMLMPFIPEF